MSHLIKSLCVDIIVLLLGAGVWHVFLIVAENHHLELVPPHGTILMGLYMFVYSIIALYAHHLSIAGLPYEDDNGWRHPSYMLAVMGTIVLMIFIVARSTNNPVIWAMGW